MLAPAQNEYRQRQPQATLLHAIVREHFETLRERSLDPDDPTIGLPKFVVREFEAFLACGDPSRGFVRLKCERCRLERILPFSCKTRTLCPSCSSRRMVQTAAFLVDYVLPDVPLRQWVLSPPFPLVAVLGARADVLSEMNRVFVSAVLALSQRRAEEGGARAGRSGAVTFIQRFSSSLLLYPHLHVVALDGVFIETEGGALRFVGTRAPSEYDMADLADRVARRIAKLLERLRLLDDTDDESKWSPLMRWYAGVLRDAAGLATIDEQKGQVDEGGRRSTGHRSTGEAHGFSVHAKVTVRQGDKAGRERLCLYAARPPLADEQLSMADDGRVAIRLRKSRMNGDTHAVLEPERLLRRLAWIIPHPHKHQIRFAGVLAPNSKWRARVVPREQEPSEDACAHLAPVPLEASTPPTRPRRAAALPWRVLLRRVYDLEALECEHCGGRLRPVAVILDPNVAQKILRHLGRPAEPPQFARSRAPP